MGETLAPEVFFLSLFPILSSYFPVTCPLFSRQWNITVVTKCWAYNHTICTCRISFGLLEVIGPLPSKERWNAEILRNSKGNCCCLFSSARIAPFMINNSRGVSVRCGQHRGGVLPTDLKPPCDIDLYWIYQLQYHTNKWHYSYPRCGNRCFICIISFYFQNSLMW